MKDYKNIKVVEYKGNAVVAFIDLLGFSNEIISKWNIKKNNPAERLLKIQRKIQKKIRKEKNIKLFNENGDFITKSPYGKLNLISDSFTLIFPVEGKNSNENLASILNTCATIFEIWQICLKFNFSIRAGVDYGQIFFNEKEIIGPSFIRAYYIESHIASSSRVVLSGNALKLISKNLKKCNSDLKEFFSTWFVVDVDGYVILNDTIMFGYRDIHKKSRKKGLKRLRKIQEMAPKPRLKEKYQGMISRLKSHKLPNSNSNIFDLYRD